MYPSQSGNPDEAPIPIKTTIQRDGTYVLPAVPLGQAQVSVETSPPIKIGINPSDPPREMFGPYVKIPLHYADRAKSGFALEVKKGKQELNLELKGEPKQ